MKVEGKGVKVEGAGEGEEADRERGFICMYALPLPPSYLTDNALTLTHTCWMAPPPLSPFPPFICPPLRLTYE